MATINPDYMTSRVIEQLFVDKVTGNPLSGGKVYFYKDNDRNTLKPVYQLTGTPGNYTYTALPNPVILNTVGAFPEAVYYYPFDEDGAIELYYIKVYSANDVDQNLDRQAWPNYTGSDIETNKDFNFISNGQFLLHNFSELELSEDVTDVAYGGWTFERSSGTSIVNNIKFNQTPSYTTNPTDSPRYLMEISATSIGGSPGTRQDICATFNNVNTFASDTQFYTFSFWGKNLISTTSVEVIVRKFYGTGGSATTEDIKSTISINTSGQQYYAVFTFGNNTGKTIGILNDDYVQVIIRLPVNNLYDLEFSDCMLLQGDKINLAYPTTPTREDVMTALGGGIDIPAYDGSDLGLSLILSKTGITYDTSVVGQLSWDAKAATNIGDYWRICDGSSQNYSDTWDEGVPKSRLADRLWDEVLSQYIYFGGYDYVTCDNLTTATLYIYNNSLGTVTASSAGNSGFTVNDIYTAISNGYYVNAYKYDMDKMYVFAKYTGAVSNGFSAGTSGFTIANVRLINAGNPDYDVSPYIWSITTVADSAGSLRGTYFLFSSLDSNGGTQTDYYVWFKVDGTGADPAVGGRTGILCNLISNDTNEVVLTKIIMALNDFQGTYIVPTAASSITAGHYFEFTAKTSGGSQLYVVWFTIDGSGTEPVIAGAEYIKCELLSADTDIQVTTKIIIAISKAVYGLPDARGFFLRALDSRSPSPIDPDNQNRFSYASHTFYGAYPGTIEFDTLMSHKHNAYSNDTGNTGAPEETFGNTVPHETSAYGNYETRPKNMYFNFKIHI